ERGVPHIRAENEADMYRALGFVHAQDRLFQMEMLRRLLYEALAELGLDPTDTYRRVFGLAPSVPWLDGRE
ncbi:penicillin acylase family protein, partial [Pseudomonas otitidis]